MVQRHDDFIRGDVSETICHAVGAGRGRFPSYQRRSFGGTLGASWRMEDHGCAKALHEDAPHSTVSVSRAAIGLLRYPAPGAGIGVSGSYPPGAGEVFGGSGSNPPGAGEEVILPDVLGVPDGAFVCT